MLFADDGAIPADFEDPYLELLRLLHEAAEVEHALMVQYLYAAFSLKQDVGLTGVPVAGSHALLGVAVQEMQHLNVVNELLVRLGAAPCLTRQDFPYEPDIYPFALSLEPLSLLSLAKYTYAEAPTSALGDSGDPEVREMLVRALGSEIRPNHIGNLYGTIIDVFDHCRHGSPPVDLHDGDRWRSRLEGVRDSGENEHFHFFSGLLLGHALPGPDNPWLGPPAAPAYPAHPLPSNPTAYRRHHNQITDRDGRDLAWLGNLHYWIVLVLLDLSYRYAKEQDRFLAQRHMRRPLYQLGMHLAERGLGLPFDVLSMGYSPGRDEAGTRGVLGRLVAEAAALATRYRDLLPAGFELGIYTDSLARSAGSAPGAP